MRSNEVCKKERAAFGAALTFHLSPFTLLEGILTQAFAAQCEILHVARHVFAEVFIDIEFGEVLAEHEAMATQASKHAHLGIDDVARLHVIAGPHSVEAHGGEVRNPVGEDLGADLQELLAVVFEVLSSLESVAVG